MRALVAAFLVGVAGLGAYFMWHDRSLPAEEAGDPAKLDALPRIPLGPLTASEQNTFVVFLDGYGRWFAIYDTEALRRLEIGVYTTRFFEIFTGGKHIPVRAEGGKELFVSTNGDVTAYWAFANPDRMDLRELRPLAHPVDFHRKLVTREDYADELARISKLPDARVVRQEKEFGSFAFSRRLNGSVIWWHGRQDWPSQQDIESAVALALPDGVTVRADLAFWPRSNPDALDLQIDGRNAQVPGLYAADLSLFAMCQSANACQQIDAETVAATLAPWASTEIAQIARRRSEPSETDGEYRNFDEAFQLRLVSEEVKTLQFGLSYITPRDAE